MKRAGVMFMSLIITAFSISFCFAGELTLWGSTTCQKRMIEPTADMFEKETGIKVTVMGVGTGKGLLALLDGKTPASLTSNNLEGSIKSAQKVRKKAGKPEVEIPDNLQFHKIVEDIIVPIVNVKNPVTELTFDQLKDINTGKITNWKDVGGDDLPIIVVTSHAGSSTKKVYQDIVMKKEPYIENAKIVKSTRKEINEVVKFKGAIGAVSEGFVKLSSKKVKIIKTDTISRPLALITVGAPSEKVQKMIDFLNKEETQKHFK